MPRGPVLDLGVGVLAAMAGLIEIAGGGFVDHGFLPLILLTFIAGGSISLSALNWKD